MSTYKGLSQAEVAERAKLGHVNISDEKTSRSLSDIIRANVLTRFNALITALFIAVMIAGGELIDGLFFIAVIINSGMGIVQELRAKRALDSLRILNEPHLTVVRDGKDQIIHSSEIVVDDLVRVKIGDQIPTDGVVVETSGVEIDESLLTGEADPVPKDIETVVLSGSFVVAGEASYRVTAVGADSYAFRLTKQIKQFKRTRSELQEGTNKLLGYISLTILIVAPVLIWGQLTRASAPTQEAIVRSSSAIVGMIPEGLVLLTSFSFVLAALALARRKVLVQEMPAVEGLARVDVICLDKTGTLTEGKIVFKSLKVAEKTKTEVIEAILSTFAAKPDSPTLHALHEVFTSKPLKTSSTVAFNSKQKWSAVNIEGNGWVLGAPEIVTPNATNVLRVKSDKLSAKGYRVMLLAKSPETAKSKQLPPRLSPQAIVVLEEKVRADAPETLRYFAEQGVQLKIISGDSPRTVAAIARRVGIDVSKPVDARELSNDINVVADILEENNVFGRVLPEQKQLFVKALQSRGHVVAMTGDGVNDALALKDADIGIAMGNGAMATRSIAQIVLMDNTFSHMPKVLAEGRRVIANIERVASLFLIKNVYNLTFALAVTVLGLSFPFLPRHLTIISWITIGIPAFFLALAPNSQRYRPGFLPRVLKFAIPVGVLIAITALGTYAFTLQSAGSIQPASSTAVISVVTICLWVVARLAKPLNYWKLGLILSMAGLFIVMMVWPTFADLFEFYPTWPYNFIGFVAGLFGAAVVELIWHYNNKPQIGRKIT